MKKLLSLGLALVMCLALAIPVLAEEQTFSTENSALTPTIEVDLPSSAAVILNPYGMKYTVTGTAPAGITNNTTDQIISNIFAVTNKTKGCNLEVKCKVTGDVGGNAQLVGDKDAGLENDTTATNLTGKKFITTGNKAETGNKVHMILSYNFNGTGGGSNGDEGLLAAAPTFADMTKLVRTANYKKIITDSETELDTIVLAPAVGTKYSYIIYQFYGVAVPKPAEAWTEEDTVGATFVYTFTATPAAVTTAS